MIVEALLKNISILLYLVITLQSFYYNLKEHVSKPPFPVPNLLLILSGAIYLSLSSFVIALPPWKWDGKSVGSSEW